MSSVESGIQFWQVNLPMTCLFLKFFQLFYVIWKVIYTHTLYFLQMIILIQLFHKIRYLFHQIMVLLRLVVPVATMRDVYPSFLHSFRWSSCAQPLEISALLSFFSVIYLYSSVILGILHFITDQKILSISPAQSHDQIWCI